MAHDAAHRPDAKRTAARRRALRRRAAAWRRAARRAVTLALAAGMLCGPVADARAQMGQAAMAPAAGLVNGGLQRFQNLSENGPGWMYWGLNAADRGLGYVGSYMTLGGFIPMAEDDLGGFWSADLRSHLSNYGGFFSNVGAVRKQFIGGTLLGVGVYWDYDGDQNQYAATPIVGTPYTFAGGQSYNQVGVSGEWLTDWGNLRSNGYIPVGTTAQLTGPFVGNVVLCQNGLNAALSGADLEVGAYVPGLSDWAGMVSVGGYALGNTRYSYPNGTAAVPWFGGVYTRLDMTLLKNWDFSLQANNDSYFDWTGFARLTYRMGGSRRRNVPDQMEQPMMRNEHIVRAYQAPETAINPETGTPWRVFHVDNSVTVPGNGTAESPFATLTQAQSAASAQYDIVYVHVGASASTPYITPVNGYTFQNQNQYLVGEGSTYQFDTLNCGPDALFASSNSSLYPNLTNPIGPAIAVTENGSVVSHLRITRTPVGIVGAGMPAGGVATISDVIVAGGAGILQRGVEITSTAGTFNFDRLQLRDLDDSGLVQTGATSVVNVTNSTFDNVEGTALLVSGSAARATITRTSFDGTTGNGLVASGAGSRIVLTSSTVSNTTGNAIAATGAASTFVGTDFTVRDTGGSGLVASGSGSTVAAVRGSVLTTGGDALVVSGPGATMNIVTTRARGASGNGANVSGAGSRFFMSGTSSIDTALVDGVRVTGDDATVLVQDSSIVGSGNNGVSILSGPGSTSMQVTLLRSTIRQTAGYAIDAQGASGPNEVVQVFGSTISEAGLGISARNSNLDVGRDPTQTNGRITTIQNAGDFGVAASGNSRVRVATASITGVDIGILADNGNDVGGNAGTVTQLTATNNSINATTYGVSVIASGTSTTFTGSQVRANIASNRITTSGSTGIRLETQNPVASPGRAGAVQISNAGSAAELGAVNFNTTVLDTPVTTPTQVIYNSPPPLPPPQPSPLIPDVPPTP